MPAPLPSTDLNKKEGLVDPVLLWTMLLLIAIGSLAISSASTYISEKYAHNPWFFTKRHLQHLIIASLLFLSLLQIPLYRWCQFSSLGLWLSLLSLVVTLLVGHKVNGSTRWIPLFGLKFQPCEYAKWAYLCYLARYLSLKTNEIMHSGWGFVKPFAVLCLLAVCLLYQPDFGSMILIFCFTLVLLFLANARLWQFLLVALVAASLIIALLAAKPYRLQRLHVFLHPWRDPFGAGYQLTQALMAFARGGWLGQGLGYGVQKIAYLPDAHTDFILASFAEETGYLGLSCYLTLFGLFLFRIARIAYCARANHQRFGAFLSYGILSYFALQTGFNVGGITGLLPLKGLTIPLMSYGGSSLFVTAMMLAALVRVDFENRQMVHKHQAIAIL